MTDRQRNILFLGVVAAVVAGAYPPWSYTVDAPYGHSRKPAGYYFILDPPTPEQKNEPAYGVSVDTQRLLIEWGVIALVVAGLFWNLHGSDGNPSGVSAKPPGAIDQSKPAANEKRRQSQPPKQRKKEAPSSPQSAPPSEHPIESTNAAAIALAMTDIKCDKCGKPMIVRSGRRGEFLACSGYPECRNILMFKRDSTGKIVPLPRPTADGNGCNQRRW